MIIDSEKDRLEMNLVLKGKRRFGGYLRKSEALINN